MAADGWLAPCFSRPSTDMVLTVWTRMSAVPKKAVKTQSLTHSLVLLEEGFHLNSQSPCQTVIEYVYSRYILLLTCFLTLHISPVRASYGCLLWVHVMTHVLSCCMQYGWKSSDIASLMQKICNANANALDFRSFCVKTSDIYVCHNMSWKFLAHVDAVWNML